MPTHARACFSHAHENGGFRRLFFWNLFSCTCMMHGMHNMLFGMRVHAHTCMHDCMHSRLHAYMLVCMHDMYLLACMIRTCLHANLLTFNHAYMHTCAHAYMHACLHACMLTCMHIYMLACILACIDSCLHASMYVHVCMRTC